MKYLMLKSIVAVIFVSLAGALVACSKGEPNLKVGKWGPQSMVLGDIPNKQPDGRLGIWIEVSREGGPGDVQVLFDGIPQPTAIKSDGVTTGVPPEQLMKVGKIEVVIKQLSTGKTYPVGTFVINPRQ